VFVKPATVIAWHRRGFQRYWRWRSRKPGRPRIPVEHIALIRRISGDQPGWGEDRIAEELAIKLGIRAAYSSRSRGKGIPGLCPQSRGEDRPRGQSGDSRPGSCSQAGAGESGDTRNLRRSLQRSGCCTRLGPRSASCTRNVGQEPGGRGARDQDRCPRCSHSQRGLVSHRSALSTCPHGACSGAPQHVRNARGVGRITHGAGELRTGLGQGSNTDGASTSRLLRSRASSPVSCTHCGATARGTKRTTPAEGALLGRSLAPPR